MEEVEKRRSVINIEEIDLIEVFQKIWIGRRIIFKWMAIFFGIGLIIVLTSPKEYKSQVILLVETGAGSSGMSGFLQQFGGLAGVNFGGGASEDALTPELYPDIIQSTPFLLEMMNQKIIEFKNDSLLQVSEYFLRFTKSGVGSLVIGYTFGLPGKVIGWIMGKPKSSGSINIDHPNRGPLKLSTEQLAVIGQLVNRIKAKQGESANTLVISVEMQDPFVAAQLADSVVLTLTRYITEYRTQKAKMDLKFVQERHKEAEARYIVAQQNLARYKDRNRNVILASAQTSEQNLQAEFNLTFNVYNSLSQQLEQAKMKVQEKTPVFKVIEPAKVALGKSSPRTSLILVVMLFFGGFVGLGIIFTKYLFTFKINEFKTN